MADQVSTTDLVKQMSGRDTLNGWDVLISYDEAQINSLLNLRAETITTLKNMVFSNEEDSDESDEKIKVTYNLTLGEPRLQFLGSAGRVRLSLGLKGTRTKDGKKSWTIPSGFDVMLETELINVSGTLSDTSNPATADFVPAHDAAVTAAPANFVTLMPPDAGAAKAICLNFQDEKISVGIVSNTKPAKPIPTPLLVTHIRLREYLRESAGLKYYLAGLSNVYAEAAGSDLLKPKTFCFTCIPGNPAHHIPGSMCMWIGVNDDGSGTKPTGQTSVTFHPSDKDLQPIPKESTASAIFSHKLMTKYIVAAMKEKNVYDDFTVTSVPGTAGMEIKGKCNKKISKDYPTGKEKGAYNFPLGIEWEWYSSINFDMHDEDTTFTFGKQDPFRDISISYLSGTQNLNWGQVIAQPGITNTVAGITTSLKFFHGGSAIWTDDRTPGTKTPNMLKLQFTLPANFEIKDKNSTEKILLLFNLEGAEPPEKYKEIDIALPTIDFNLRALDYFLTTNLILPGAHLFIADEPSGKEGAEHGLYMPRDVLLTGKVAKELVNVQT